LLLLHGINLERPERTLYVRGGIRFSVGDYTAVSPSVICLKKSALQIFSTEES